MPAAGISGNRSTISSNAGVNKRSMRNDTGTKPPEKKMRLDATASDDASVSAQLFAPWPIRVGSTASSTNAPNPSPSVGTSATNPSQAAQVLITNCSFLIMLVLPFLIFLTVSYSTAGGTFMLADSIDAIC